MPLLQERGRLQTTLDLLPGSGTTLDVDGMQLELELTVSFEKNVTLAVQPFEGGPEMTLDASSHSDEGGLNR